MSSKFTYNRFSSKWVTLALVLTVLFWLWFGLVVGVTELEIGFFLMLTFQFFFNFRSRQLAVTFSPFFIYMILYSSLKILHLYNPFPIHIQDIYDLEKSLFGFIYEGQRIAPCDFFENYTNTFFDLISVLFYITWVPFPVVFTLYLFYTRRRKIAFDFWTSFLITNLIGFMGYIFLPAAPPWYILEYGAELHANVGNSPAGLIRFDQLVGIHLYQGMYANGTNAFGAMPSMHAAFPLILVYYSLKFKKKLLTLLFAVSMISIWFAAIYSNHHYIVDVIAGIFCGILGIFLTESLVNRKFAPNWYKRAIDYINIPKSY